MGSAASNVTARFQQDRILVEGEIISELPNFRSWRSNDYDDSEELSGDGVPEAAAFARS